MDDALFVARRIAMKVLVVPVGARREASKVVERLATLAAPLGVAVAIDSRSPSVTPIGSLVHFVEQADTRIGIALDFATAGKGGALIDAIELSAEHLVSVRVPLDATLDWSGVMTTVQKVGYDGPIVMDATAPGGSGKEMLARARRSREQMERWLTSI
jgi:sugar phosphate isomerase/epimerase